MPGPDPAVRLRVPRADDLDAIAVIAADARTAEHLPNGVRDAAASAARLQRWIDDWAAESLGYWVIEDPGGPAVIGWGGVRVMAAGDGRVVNLAYRLAATHWGRGIAGHVARRGVALAAERRPELPVVARMTPENVASKRAAVRAGLARVGEDRWGWTVLADRPLGPELVAALPAP